MTRKICGFYGALLMLGASYAGSGMARALPLSVGDEEVRVVSPYTIRQQVLDRSLTSPMLTTRISVEKSVSFSDLDLTKPADVNKMKARLRQAAKDSCKELNRRFPRSIYVTLDDTNCVKNATHQSLARFEAIISGAKQTARVD